ncbi:MAG: carbohydrate ABC transporter permease [Propionibacteriaceae bacterium]|jgi:cellobiose transport system permease protein|nr:carbohydrate ABC transporter permease [Propionibacteriaceae bacterium]
MSAKTQPSVAFAAAVAGKGAARAVAKRNRKMSLTSEGRRPGWPTYLLLGLVILVSIYPLYYAVQLSSLTVDQMHDFPGLGFGSMLWSNLVTAFNDLNFVKAFLNTLMVAVIMSVSVVAFSTLAGYTFAKLRFKGRGPLMVFVVATMAIPAQLSAIPLYIIMSKLGLYGSLAAVILPGLVTAFGVFWMTQYITAALPYELIEAARVDGCSMIKTFYHVAIPAALPAGALLALFTFVAQWTNYYWPMLIIGTNSSNNPLLTLAVANLAGGNMQNYTIMMAGVVLSAFPLIILFFVAGKQLVAGIMAGAVKG